MKEKVDNEISVQTKMQKLQKLSVSAISLIVGIIVVTIGILAVFITIYFINTINFASEKCQFKIDNVPLNIIFTLVTLAILYLIYKILPKINRKVLLVIALTFGLAIGLLWVNYIEFKPISDQSMVVYCGDKLNQNDLPTILNPR